MPGIFDITALGELLIDFTDAGDSVSGARLFERNPGGAPANVAVGAARLGLKTAFIGKIGEDTHGHFLKQTLETEKVDCRNLLLDSDVFTTLAFVELDTSGERKFSFSRGADIKLEARDLDFGLIKNSKILHTGTLSMTDEPSRSAVLKAVEYAKSSGVTVSLDVNYRAPLWGSPEEFKNATELLLPYITLLKVSEEEAELLGEPVFRSVPFTVVTRGERGATILRGAERLIIPAVPAESVADTTGAGDAFWSGILYEYVQNNCDFYSLTGKLAAKAASLCVRKRGAIPAMPTLAEVI